MTCPNCDRNLTMLDAARTRCPHCGCRLNRKAVGVVKTSSVRVAAGDNDLVYRSIEELPPRLRHQLQQALSSPNAETILIADEPGREQIFQVINGLPPEAQKKVLAALRFSDQPRPHLSATLRAVLLAASLLFLTLLLWLVWSR